MKNLCNHKNNPLECNSYPFCWGCNAFTGTAEDVQQQLDEHFAKQPYDVKLNIEKCCANPQKEIDQTSK